MKFLYAYHLLMLCIYASCSGDDDTTDCNEIPISFGKTINQFDSYSEFIRGMVDLNDVDVDKRDQIYLLANSSGEDYVNYERSIAIRPKPASCQPDSSIVSLRPENETDPTMIYYPSCTRLRRCGGCCSHKLLRFLNFFFLKAL